MLLRRKAIIALGPEMVVLDIVVSCPCRPAPRRAADWEFARARRRAPREIFFSSASSAGISDLSRATSAISACAAASSLLFFAAPISFDAALRRASAASAFWMAARRRSSISISRFASPLSPRRASPRSKASGLSRIHLMSCMTDFPSSSPALCRASTSSDHKDQDVDGRDKPGHDELAIRPGTILRQDHSAGLAAALAASLALSAAAFFSTSRTDQIEPSYSSISGKARESWLSTSGGVSTAAITNAPTMK